MLGLVMGTRSGDIDAGIAGYLHREAGMSVEDIEIDEQRNSQSARGARRISTDSSRVAVLVVPTNEELAIARDCLTVV